MGVFPDFGRNVCITHGYSVGTWQFLTELPYNAASQSCLRRVQVLLRATDEYRFGVLCQMSNERMLSIIHGELSGQGVWHVYADDEQLVSRVSSMSLNQSTYLISALGRVAMFDDDQAQLLEELFCVCSLAALRSARTTSYASCTRQRVIHTTVLALRLSVHSSRHTRTWYRPC
jgi:hypothetical protein